MKVLILFLIIMGTIPFLFPDACRAWLEKAQRWLVAYEDKRRRQWRAEDAVAEETREWRRWIQHAKRTLTKVKTIKERSLLLAQIQAAGERFLAGLTRWEEGKPTHPAVDAVEKKTTALLELLDAEQKKRGEAT